MPDNYLDLGAADGRQKGTYRGLRTSVHCHFVGGNDHLQIGEDRYPIRWLGNKKKDDIEKQNEITNLRGAWESLKAKGNGTAGVADCKMWLKSYLVEYHGINASKVT